MRYNHLDMLPELAFKPIGKRMTLEGGKAKAPPAPDYIAAANATAAGNLETAKYTTAANRVNQVTPYGNLTYSMTPTIDQGAYDKAMADYQSQLSNYNQELQNYNSQSRNQSSSPFGMGIGGMASFSNQNQNLTSPIAPIAPTADKYQTGQSWTATQTLSPEQQAIYEQESKLNQGLMATANRGLNYANDVLSQPGVDMSKLPSIASSIGGNLPAMTSNVPGGQYATSYNVQNATGNVANPNVQSSLDLSGMPSLKSSIDTQGLPSYGINPGETYSDAIMRRLQPDLERQRAAEEARLANQGIGLGSNAYSTAKDILGRQQNDALTSAIVQGMGVGLQANQQQFGQNAAQTQAQNAANAQAYQQALASGQFGNQAAGQQFGQNLNAAQLANQAAAQNTGNAANLAAFGNQGIGQQFQQGLANAQLGNQANLQSYNQQLQNAQLQNQAQQQGFQQSAYNQMQPINVINALRTGSQVQSPSYAQNAQMPQVAGADLLGATQQGYNAQLANVNAQNAASGGFMSGLMGLGGAALSNPAIFTSDVNAKENIVKIGTLNNGLNLYTYNYKDGYDLPEGRQVGVIAQEVEEVMPEAVVAMPNGFKGVNYAMLGV